MSPTPLFDSSLLAWGASLRDEGIARAGSGGPVVPLVLWQTKAKEWVEALPAGSEVTSEELREAVGDPPHFNCMGGVFMRAARQGILEPVGLRKATRPGMHATQLRVWRRG